MKEKGFFCIFSEDKAHLQLEEVYFLKTCIIQHVAK